MSSLLREDNLHRGFVNLPWQVHKFGGTSVANAECYTRVARIVEEQLFLKNLDSIRESTLDVGIKSNNVVNQTDERCSIRLAVVVSAIGGKPKTTDLLLDSVKFAAERNETQVDNVLNLILEKHRACLEGLFKNCIINADHEYNRLSAVVEKDICDIRDILKTVSLMKWQAQRISELVSGYGELWSAQILTALMNLRQQIHWNRHAENGKSKIDFNHNVHQFVYLDARRVITVDEDVSQNGAMVWDVSKQKLQQVFEDERQSREDRIFHFVMTGYVAVNTHGVSTTLQRDGSDYSAAIIGRLLVANSISIWTDVDGVLSADPRRVPLAQVLPEVSYNEAMELAYFGAKVIHPKTMQPAIECDPQIPIYIRNTFHSSFRGSRIYTSSASHMNRDQVVCGFSSIEHMAMINVEGSGMIGVPGVSRRLFGTLERAGVNVVLISQASSEHSVTFATTCEQSTVAKVALEDEFRRELEQRQISNIDVKEPCSIIAAVGDGMAKSAGCAGRFFSALGDAKINIVAIAQGCSERNISAVVKMEDSSRALRAVHSAFRLSHTTIRIGIVGMNDLGLSLLKLLETQRNSLKSTFDIDLQVCAIVPMIEECDDGIICLKNDKDGCTDSITVGAFHKAFGTKTEPSHASFLDETCAENSEGGAATLLGVIFRPECTNHVIFDCTNSESIGRFHAEWLRATIDVVTANNTGLSGPKEQRDQIVSAEKMFGKESASYLREVTVGGGLPVIKTLRSLLQTGDKVRRVDGILSVSLSYIMFRISPPQDASVSSQYDEEYCNGAFTGDLSPIPSSDVSKACSFTEAIKEALALGLMESDFSKDLNNDYTCRVLMVLARELGMDHGIETMELRERSDKLLDKILGGNVDYALLSPEVDQRVKERVDTARSRGCVLRHVASIDVLSRQIDIKIVEVPDHHIFAVTPPSCECFRFFTKRHLKYPLIIQGPSAGVDSTASALLAELLHLMRGKTTPTSVALSRTGSGAVLHSIDS
jgi:bifunctional aspartokinase / homoserine dehydrogenase 1